MAGIRSPRSRTLRVDLVLGLALLIVLAAVSLSLAGQWFSARRHTQQQHRRWSAYARSLADSLAPAAAERGASLAHPSVERLLRAALAPEEVLGAQVVDGTTGRPRIELGPWPAGLAPPSRGRGRTEVADGSVVYDEPVFAPGGGNTSRLVLRLWVEPPPWLGADALAQTVVPALALGAVFAALAGLLVERDVLRPLRAVRAATSRIAAGDLAARAPLDGPDEIRALAGDFNRMADALAGIVEQRAAERERLLRSEQLATLGRLTAGVAHEVGNPLAAIAGYIDMLRADLRQRDDNPETQAILERAAAQVERIRGLVDQLVRYGRAAPLHPVAGNAYEHIKNLVELLRHDRRLSGVALDVRSGGDASIETDWGLVDQIVQNLVVNAARAARSTAPPHLVEVHVRPTSTGVAVDVQDSGAGVPDEAAGRLFEPFFTTAPAGEGTGLGLSISRELATKLGGRLTLVSGGADGAPRLADGRPAGAVFRLELPHRPTSAPEAGADAPRPDATAVPWKTGRKAAPPPATRDLRPEPDTRSTSVGRRGGGPPGRPRDDCGPRPR